MVNPQTTNLRPRPFPANSCVGFLALPSCPFRADARRQMLKRVICLHEMHANNGVKVTHDSSLIDNTPVWYPSSACNLVLKCSRTSTMCADPCLRPIVMPPAPSFSQEFPTLPCMNCGYIPTAGRCPLAAATSATFRPSPHKLTPSQTLSFASKFSCPLANSIDLSYARHFF